MALSCEPFSAENSLSENNLKSSPQSEQKQVEGRNLQSAVHSVLLHLLRKLAILAFYNISFVAFFNYVQFQSTTSKLRLNFRLIPFFFIDTYSNFFVCPHNALCWKNSVCPLSCVMTEFKHFQFMLLERLIWIKDWNKDENSRLWRFIASSVTFCFKFCAGSKYCLKASFRINSLFDWQVLNFFRMSPQRAMLKKSLCSLSCLLTEFIDFQFMLPRACDLDRGVE